MRFHAAPKRLFTPPLALVLMATALAPVALLARNPPPLKGKTPVDISGPAATDDPHPLPQPWLRGVARKPQDGTSSGRYALPPQAAPRSSISSDGEGAAAAIVEKNPWLRLAVNAVPSFFSTIYDFNVSNNSSNGDEEPSIAMLNRDGYTNTTVAWIRRQPLTSTQPFKTYLVADRMRNVATTGSVQHTYATNLNVPTGYTDLVDPVLAVNPYTSGLRPLGMYLVGMALNRDVNGAAINPQGIRIWVSSDAGASWDNVGLGVAYTSGSDIEVDKPWVDVSWHPGSLGYVYVVWTEIDNLTGQNRVIFRRSISGVTRVCRPTGGACIDPFNAPVVIQPNNGSGWSQCPMVAVNPSNGDIAVLWINGPGIRMRLSTDYGVTFGPVVDVASLNRFDYTMPSGLRAVPAPMARFNTITNKLMVVWHDVPVTNQGAAVYYKTFDARTVTSATMPSATVINQVYDQWQPAVDNDNAGNALIAYLSNETDGYNLHPMGVYIGTTGAIITGPAILRYGSGASPSGPAHPGDYHDVWYWSDFLDGTSPRWHNTWGAQAAFTADTDVRLSGVQ